MYIGLLNDYVVKKDYTHAGVSVPLPATDHIDGRDVWEWNKIYDTSLDVNFELEHECFIGALTADIISESIAEVYAVVDGKVSGKYVANNPFEPKGIITVNVGAVGKKVTLRIRGDLKEISLGGVDILGSFEDAKPLIFPTPKKQAAFKGYTKIKDFKYTNDDEHAAAQFLYDRLKERYDEPLSDKGVTVTFKMTDDPGFSGERYTVRITDTEIIVTAASRIALIYGADTIMQMSTKRGIHQGLIDDKPDFPMRGFHIGLPSREQLPFVKNLFTYVLIPMRYNFIIVEFAGGMRFDSHPKITEKWLEAIERAKAGKQPDMPHSGMVGEHTVLEKDDVRWLVKFARDVGIDVVPEIQSLGHVQFLTYAYPEIAEIDPEREKKKIDVRDEDMPPNRFYHHCYCPSNPKSYEIMYDLIDEIIDVVRPTKYVHIGHDEVYQLGVCPVCQDKDPAKLFEDDVKKLYDYITKKGYKIMMWSDMLHPRSRHSVKAAPSVDKLPKDIVMLDFTWYFHLEDDIETELLEHGYKVGIGNLYSSHFPRFKERLSREGMVGGQTSPWVTTRESKFADHGKFFDACLVAEMLWNKDGYIVENQPTYVNVIAKYVQPLMRDNIRGTLSRGGYETVASYTLSEGEDIPSPLKELCPAAKVSDEFEIAIDDKCDRLVFEHATVYNAHRKPWYAFLDVGNYTVHYDDGTTEVQPVRYAAEILKWNTHYGQIMPHQMYRHHGYVGTWYADPVLEGKIYDGNDMLVTGLVWNNPHPDKKVVKVTYKRDENDYCRLILNSIKVQKNNDNR